MIRSIYDKVFPEAFKAPLYRLKNKIYGDLLFYVFRPFIPLIIERRLSLSHPKFYWLFIMGCSNSGTTLLQRILERHREIRSLPHEGQHLTKSLPLPKNYNCSRLWGNHLNIFRWTQNHDPKPALRAKFDWSKYFKKGVGICLEKSPTNALRSLWIQKNFPPSKFIMMTRNPYAVCEGVMRRTGCAVEEAASHWKNVNEVMIKDSEMLKYKIIIDYETLTDNPEKLIPLLNDFLGVDSPIDISFFTGTHNILERKMNIKNLNAESIKKLSSAEINSINKMAGSLIEKTGYTPIIP